LSSFVVFVEGDHDITFFQEFIESKRIAVKTTNTKANITDEIRKLLSGALLINCGGSSHIYFQVPRIMKQMIWGAGHRILVIGDGDRMNPQKLANRLREYIHTPCKSHVLNFQIIHKGDVITLVERSKETAVQAQVHTVPINLETQILNTARSIKKVKLPNSGNEDKKLLAVAKKLGYNDVNELIKKSVNWFTNTPWLKPIEEKLS
jgi:hypothetical protein